MNIFLAKKDLQTFPKQDIYTLTNYHELSAKNYDDLLWLLALSIHSQDAPLLSGGLMSFAKYLEPLLIENETRNDPLIPSLDRTFVRQFLWLTSEQEWFKEIKNDMSKEERIVKSKVLSNQEKNLKKHPDWKKLQDFKAIFDVPLADPTWVIESYLYGGISRLEDIKSRLQPALQELNYLQHKVVGEEIINGKAEKITIVDGNNVKYNNFCGLEGCDNEEGLEGFLKKYEKQLSEYHGKVQKKETARKGAKLLLDGETVTVYRPMTEEGACYYGQGTRWCTAATKWGNLFYDYNWRGPLYILIPKKAKYNQEKYQVHFFNKQYMDEKDDEVKMDYLLKRFPELNSFLPFLAGNKKLNKFFSLLKQGERRGVQEASLEVININGTEIIDEILDMGITLDIESLNMAIKNDNTRLANKIMDEGVPPDVDSLNLAIKNNNMMLANKIMDKKVPPNVNSLNLAIKNNNMEFVHQLMNAGVSPDVNSLNQATKKNNINLVNIFLEKGVSPDVKSLNSAIENNNINLVNIFLAEGIPSVVDSLNFAFENGYINIANILLESGVFPNVDSLNLVIEDNNISLANTFLEEGVSPNVDSLNLAIRNGRIILANKIMNKGVPPNVKSLNLAIQDGFTILANKIMDEGVTPNVESLNYVIKNNITELANKIIDKGVTPDEDSLYYATQNKNETLINRFSNMGVRPTVDTLRLAMRDYYNYNNEEKGDEILKKLLNSWCQTDKSEK